VPSSFAVLGRQRRRWHRGITEILWKHRAMLLASRYGRVGLLALPWYVLFELLAPFVELLGAAYLVALAVLGLLDVAGLVPRAPVDWTTAGVLLAMSWGYAFLLTVASLALEEFSFHRYRRWRDLGVALTAALLENIGYRQLTAWWRVHGTLQAIRGEQRAWGQMPRGGFDVGHRTASP